MLKISNNRYFNDSYGFKDYFLPLLVKSLKKDVTVEEVLENGCICVTSFVFFLLFEGVEVEAKSPPGTLQFLKFYLRVIQVKK